MAWAHVDHSDLLMDRISNLDIIEEEIQGKSARGVLGDFISLPSLPALTKRPYLCRVWIQQELHASKNVSLHCGKPRVCMSLVHLVLDTLDKMQAKLRQKGLIFV